MRIAAEQCCCKLLHETVFRAAFRSSPLSGHVVWMHKVSAKLCSRRCLSVGLRQRLKQYSLLSVVVEVQMSSAAQQALLGELGKQLGMLNRQHTHTHSTTIDSGCQ